MASGAASRPDFAALSMGNLVRLTLLRGERESRQREWRVTTTSSRVQRCTAHCFHRYGMLHLMMGLCTNGQVMGGKVGR